MMNNKTALILSVGGSPEPLIFCINNFEHDLVYFLHSEDSKEQAFEIIDKLNIPEDKCRFKLTDHQSLEDAFAKSREIIKELQRNGYNIHVDFTGGTKTMVSGLVLAAIGEDCGYTYVGSEEDRTKNNVGVVKSGFEELKEQKDPYDLYAVMEFDKGKDFFNRYQFEAAKVNFEDANNKLESEKLKELSEIYLKIVKLYSTWDKFNNKIDDGTGREVILNLYMKYQILPKLEEFEEDINSDYPNFISQINENYEFLKLKISKNGNIKPADVKYYLADLLNNAGRRIEEGKYDDAVARLYRTIELVAQLLLLEQDLIHENSLFSNKRFVISKNKVHDLEMGEAKDFLMDLYNFNEPGNNFGIPLKKSFEVLEKFDVKIAEKYLDDKKMRNNISLRNSSILAHGLNSIDEADANDLFKEVLKYAKEVFPEVEEYMKMARFPKFES